MDRGYLATLDMPMALGRHFSAAEDDPHGPRAVIISHGFWLQHFGGSHEVIGKNLNINGLPTRIVGVLPQSFPHLFGNAQLLLPLRAAPGLVRDTSLMAIARLDAHTSIQQLGAEAALRMRLYFAAQGKHHLDKHPFGAESVLRSMRARIGIQLLVLLGLVSAALLLLTGSNVVNLMLLRAQQQRHQLAIRAAMGASAWRLLLTALADGLLIVLIGCSAGLLASDLLLHALAEHIASIGFSGASHLALTGSMVVFAILIALLITSVGAITGARRARALSASVASTQGLHGGQDARASRLSRVLVVVQAVLATSLVGISMLLAQAAYRSAHANTGYDTRHVYSFHVLPPRQLYPDRQSLAMLAARITAALRSIPGVETAAASDLALHDGGTYDYAFKLPDGHAATVATRAISRDYLQAVRLGLLRGRPFDHADFHDGAAVAMVNAAFAKRYLHDAALGQLLGTTPKKGAPESLRIVGVTANAHTPGQAASPVVFVPLPMDPHSALVYSNGLHFLLRMHPGTTPSLASVRAKVQQTAPALAVAKLLPPSAQVPGMLAFLGVLSDIIATAGLLALLLAGMGLYAVMRVSVNARTREFGVRAALGASPRALFALILRAGLRPLAIGLVVGSVFAALLGMAAHALLLGLSGFDPSAMLLTWMVLIMTGFLATLGPALRAARTSPTVSLNESAG